MQGEIPACLCFGEGWLVMRVFLLTLCESNPYTVSLQGGILASQE